MPNARCPRCGKVFQYQRVSDRPTFPFCSQRCKLVDLYGWLEEQYRISDPLVDGLEAGQIPQEHDGKSQATGPAGSDPSP